jgi:hypothetical protein
MAAEQNSAQGGWCLQLDLPPLSTVYLRRRAMA